MVRTLFYYYFFPIRALCDAQQCKGKHDHYRHHVFRSQSRINPDSGEVKTAQISCYRTMPTSGTPSFAFVKYHDSAKAIVHISLIKKYAPTSMNELCKKKLVYWCDTGLLSDHSDEDYYSRTLWNLVVIPLFEGINCFDFDAVPMLRLCFLHTDSCCTPQVRGRKPQGMQNDAKRDTKYCKEDVGLSVRKNAPVARFVKLELSWCVYKLHG